MNTPHIFTVLWFVLVTSPSPSFSSVATTTHYVGYEKTPIIEIDNALPFQEFQMHRQELLSKDFYSGAKNGVTFPGKIARLDLSLVKRLVGILSSNPQVLAVYPRETFQMEYTHAMAAILCQKPWIHTDKGTPLIKDLVAPAAVFYFDSPQGESGTNFYRERSTNLERIKNIENITNHCDLFVNQSYACGGEQNEQNRHVLQQAGSEFEQIHQTKSIPNRMVLYPQDLLHAQVNPAKHGALPTCSVKNGRVTISIFFLKPKIGLRQDLSHSILSPHLCSASTNSDNNESESFCTPLWIPT